MISSHFSQRRVFSCVLAALLALIVLPVKSRAGENSVSSSEVTVEQSAPRGDIITLEQAYDRTLSSDQSIAIAYWEIRKANLLPWSALTKLGPNLSGNLGYAQSGARSTATRSVTTTTFTDTGALSANSQQVTATTTTRSDTGNLGLSFQQTILDLTAIPAYKLGKLTAQAARLTYQSTIRQTLFGVAQAYYTVLKDMRVAEVSRETLELAEHQLDISQKRANVGEVTRADVLRAQVTVESDRQAVIVAENTLAADRNALGLILNLSPDNDFRVIEPAPYPTTLPPFDNLLTSAYANREDLRAQSIAIGEDVQRRNEVIASYAPSVFAQWNDQAGVTHGSGAASNSSWNASIGVSMPFLTGGQREIDLITAGYQIKETRLNYEKFLKTVESDVKTAWLQVRTLDGTLKASRVQVAAAQQAYEDIQNQYRAGTSTSVDVLSALNDLNVSRRDLATQTYDYQVALRNLEQTSGVFQQQRVERVKFR